MVEDQSHQIKGRGGACLTFLSKQENLVTFIMGAGASRAEQFDDFWKVIVDQSNWSVKASKISITDQDDFTPRNAMTACRLDDNRVLMFGGQDSEKDQQFNEMFILDLQNNNIKQVEAASDNGVQVKPSVRNSHAMVQTADKAYIIGGANQNGPINDIYSLDLQSLQFEKLKLDESEHIMPMIEMHTAHIYNNEKILIMGGRTLMPGQSFEQMQFSEVIYSIDLKTFKVEEFGKLPAAIGSHVSAVVQDKYIVVYGGTNGLRFFDSILRYEIDNKRWTLMTKQPDNCKSSDFFRDGRIAASYTQSDSLALFFGGCSAAEDGNGQLVVPFNHIAEDENFQEINEIM